jgi:ferritin-like metal-binding protein YciE
MTEKTLDDQITAYLADAHSIEEQALQQLRGAPDAAGDRQLAEIFRQHLTETEGHERTTRQLLDARGEQPSKVKDLLMRVGGAGFLLFARAQPDTPGKLVAHAYSYEHMEFASYELLRRVADRADEPDIVEAAAQIAAEEQRMGERLASSFDRAVDASLRDVGPDDLDEQLNKYLADAHAIEGQAIKFLERARGAAGNPELAELYSQHLEETRVQQRLVDARLEARGGSTTALKDLAMQAGGLAWGMFFEKHPDTPGKLAVFAYAFEHLEIGGYEQLKRVAERAGDSETVALAERILGEEQAAASKLEQAFDLAAEASLHAAGVAS